MADDAAKKKTVQECVDYISAVMQDVKSANYALPHNGTYNDAVDMAYQAMNFRKGHRLKHDTWQETVPYGAELSGWKVFKRRLLPVTCILSALVSSWVIPMAMSGDDHLKGLDDVKLPIATTLHTQGMLFIVLISCIRLITGGWMLLFERLIMKEKHHDVLENLMLAVFVPSLFELLMNLNTIKQLPGGWDDASAGLTTAAVIIPCLLMALVPAHATWNMCTGWMLILTLAGPKSLKAAWRPCPGEEGWDPLRAEDVEVGWKEQIAGAVQVGAQLAQDHVTKVAGA